MKGFQCYYDSDGNLRVVNGWVIQPKTGIALPTGTGSGSLLLPTERLPDLTPVNAPAAAVFVGGSGRNIKSTGLTIPVSGAVPPVGFFVPGVAGKYTSLGGAFILEVTGSSAATISDSTGVVATLSTGGSAPVGSYASSTYGATTYNGGTAFTLTIAGEGIGTGAIPDAALIVSAGSAVTGDYVASTPALYISSTDSDWTVVIDPTGSAEMRHLTTVVATRASGIPHDPTGTYEATTAGKAACNLTDDEPTLGEPWRAFVRRIGEAPKAGWVYLEVIEVSGVLTAVNGPFFATTLPSFTPGHFYVPIAHSDGAGGVEPVHVGPLLWDNQPVVAAGLTYVEITQAAYDALSSGARNDATKIYDITDFVWPA